MCVYVCVWGGGATENDLVYNPVSLLYFTCREKARNQKKKNKKKHTY